MYLSSDLLLFDLWVFNADILMEKESSYKIKVTRLYICPSPTNAAFGVLVPRIIGSCSGGLLSVGLSYLGSGGGGDDAMCVSSHIVFNAFRFTPMAEGGSCNFSVLC